MNYKKELIVRSIKILDIGYLHLSIQQNVLLQPAMQQTI